MSLSSWGNKRPHHWLRVMLLKNDSVLKMSSERFCFALFLKMWGQLDTEGTSPDCKCCGGQKEESSLMLLDPQLSSPRRNQSWCYAALIYGARKRLLRSFSSRDPTLPDPIIWKAFFCKYTCPPFVTEESLSVARGTNGNKWHNITMSSILLVNYLNKEVYKENARALQLIGLIRYGD